jgi:hypothetical protein
VDVTRAVTAEPEPATPSPRRSTGVLATAAGMGLLALLIAWLGYAATSMAADTPAQIEAVRSGRNPWVLFYGGGAVVLMTCWLTAVSARVLGRWPAATGPLAVVSLVTSTTLILIFGAVVVLAVVGLPGLL